MAFESNVRPASCSVQTPFGQWANHLVCPPQKFLRSNGTYVSVNPIRLEEWKRRTLACAGTPEERLVADATIKAAEQMQIVSFDEFQTNLNRSFGAILPCMLSPGQTEVFQQVQAVREASVKGTVAYKSAQLKLCAIAKDAFREKAVVLVEGGKSNKWVAELALYSQRKGNAPELNFVPFMFNRLGPKDASDFTQWVQQDGNLAKLQGKSIILFDDGSYSGTQLHDHVRAIQKCAKGILNICVVVPYMTEHAKKRLMSLDSMACPVHIGTQETIPTLASLGSDGELVAREWSEEGIDLGLTAFEFKLPNYQSFPDFLAKGKLKKSIKGCFSYPFIDNAIPPYKGQDMSLGKISREDAIDEHDDSSLGSLKKLEPTPDSKEDGN